MTKQNITLSYADLTDNELLERMLQKEAKAWRQFHTRFDRLVYRCIHKVTSRFRSVLGSEDVQDIYCQFLMDLNARDMRKLRAFDPERGNKLGSWLGLLATNTAWDHLRKVSRRPVVADLDEAIELRCAAPSPHDHLFQKQRLGLVQKALGTFSEKDQQFVQLFYVDGLSPDDVANTMSISVKTVYSKKHKIRARLRESLVPVAA